MMNLSNLLLSLCREYGLTKEMLDLLLFGIGETFSHSSD